MSLEGLTCLVTGASRGIGKGVAEVLKAKGANIVISGTNEESLKKVADELEATYVVANFIDQKKSFFFYQIKEKVLLLYFFFQNH